MQKLESEPEIEWEPFAKIYIGMRPRPGNPEYLKAWSEGRTGYPFIDAAMRYLNAHGWINFRMRAMLMSFATYDLWLPWQEAGLDLARKFVDFEPGIHWSQCQMQAGETGINTIRVYSPIKQSHDQDPSGDFIRAWVPELAGVAGSMVHEPWQMQVLRLTLCPDYPLPLVDHKTASKQAKDEILAGENWPWPERRRREFICGTAREQGRVDDRFLENAPPIPKWKRRSSCWICEHDGDGKGRDCLSEMEQ
jgi:deoxyribodipyrimidine photo-lyase